MPKRIALEPWQHRFVEANGLRHVVSGLANGAVLIAGILLVAVEAVRGKRR